jgi:hypothetical protein
MTLQRLSDGSVRLAQLNEWQLRTLQSIPDAASAGDDDNALRRLFPAPFAAGEATGEQQEDWAELVQPELESLFETSLARVTKDLKMIELDTGPPEAPESRVSDETPPTPPPVRESPRKSRKSRPFRRDAAAAAPELWALTIPAAHVEDWYRAMNQARLVLSEKHHAHRTDSAHIARMFISGKMEALIQYELLTGLCGWWVDVLMRK